MTEPLLRARDLVQEFAVRGQGGVRGGVLQAVSGVSLDIYPGETLSVVGETGSGKSTLARSIMHAPPPKSGEVAFQGTTLERLHGAALRDARRAMQMIFQDPYHLARPALAGGQDRGRAADRGRDARPGQAAAAGRRAA